MICKKNNLKKVFIRGGGYIIKKLTAFTCAIMMMCSVLAIPVNAASKTENFHVYINGGSVVSSGTAKKDDSLNYMYTYTSKRSGTTVNWVSSETVNLRGRTSSGTKCTALGTRTSPGARNLTYSSGYGYKGNYYRVAVQYDNSNPYTHLDLTVKWIP